MKSIKLMILLAVVAALSCSKTDETDDIFAYNYFLYLSFMDASGNDLVKGIGLDTYYVTEEDTIGGYVKTDLYTLKVDFPNYWQSISAAYNTVLSLTEGKVFREVYPESKDNDYDLLSFYVYSHRVYYGYGVIVRVPFAEKITFKLKCPYIFGDDEEHEIVTWWKQKTKKNKGSPDSVLCYRIELGGKEFTKITHGTNEDISLATVVWESK